MRHQRLPRSWTLRPLTEAPVDGPVPATVPGCVHTDLLAAGLIPDPYLDDNETRLGWIGRTDWAYETVFGWEDAAGAAGRPRLRGPRHDRRHRAERRAGRLGAQHAPPLPVRPRRGAARRGATALTVHFSAPYGYAEHWRAELGDRPGAYAEPYPFIRKMACNFGWDWGPTLVTSGIWRPIGLEAWSVARLARVRPFADAAGNLRVHVDVEREPGRDGPLEVTAAVAGAAAAATLAPGESAAVVELRVPGARAVVAPRARRAAAVRAHRGPARPRRGRPGPRRLAGPDRLPRRAPRHRGRGVHPRRQRPPDLRPGRQLDPRRLLPAPGGPRPVRRAARPGRRRRGEPRAGVGRRRLRERATSTTCATSSACSSGRTSRSPAPPTPRRGRSPPRSRPRPATTSPAWLRHPSLALWCGNNENLEGYRDWGWRERLQGRSWGAGFYHDLLPKVVAEVDPSRPYWPGTPYSGDPGLPPNDPERGTVHIWDVWNRREYRHYRSYRPRFVAEFGFQGAARLRHAAPGALRRPAHPHLARHAPPPEGDRRQRQARRRAAAVPAACRRTSTTGTT